MMQDITKIKNLYTKISAEYTKQFIDDHERKPKAREILRRFSQELEGKGPVWDLVYEEKGERMNPLKTLGKGNKSGFKLYGSYLIILIGCLVVLSLAFGAIKAHAEWPQIVFSQDGTPISYEVYGEGEPTLVFIHGWSCDARYWRSQVLHFSKKYRVVTLDLAGHGHSGFRRPPYTMRSFGEDVRAVIEATGSNKVILIGHSMGGIVMAEAARLMPNRVIGLIGINTLKDIEYPMTSEELNALVAPLKKDFRNGSREFVATMISSRTDPRLREWILSDMSAELPAVAISAMKEMMGQYITGAATRIFEEIRLPVIFINGGRWPINYEANRRHMFSFDAIVLKDGDHFLMLDHQIEFNKALEKAIDMVQKTEG